jgi:hypothetical protein
VGTEVGEQPMKSKFSVKNISWDTDGEEVDLPTSTTLEVELEEDDDIDTVIGDALSDKFGFCLFSFDYEKAI